MYNILLAAALTWCLWLTLDMHHNYKQDKQSNVIDKWTLKALKIQNARLERIEKHLGITEPVPEAYGDEFIKNETLEMCEDLMMFGDEKFVRECFPDDPKDFAVFDLVAKYGIKAVLDKFVPYYVHKGMRGEKNGDQEFYEESEEAE